MISKGKYKYLRELFPCRFWAKYRICAIDPSRDTPKLMTYVCDGIYPVRDQPFVREVATKGYYDGCKRLDHSVDLEMFYGITTPSPTAQFLTIHRDKERLPSDNVVEVLDDFEKTCETAP